MSQPDPRAQRLIAAHLQRVLIVDPTPSARLLSDLLKELGARSIHVDGTGKGAQEACRAIQPQMIFTELNGPQLDGLAFVKAVRHSTWACRMAPITVVTGDATAQTIMASRDAGVHEFLRKPFTMKDLMRRVEAVTLKSRPWVEAVHYVGPDRRRFNSGDYQGVRKRKSDGRAPTQGERVGQALKIMRSAIDAVETHPQQAVRAMMAQAAELQTVAIELNDVHLAGAVAQLHTMISSAVSSGRLTRANLEAGAAALWAFKTEDAPPKTGDKTAA